MPSVFTWLRTMRASNLMFLFVAPVIVYLIATSRNYGPAIKAVLGIEENAPVLLGSFLFFCVTGAVGVWASLALIRSTRPDQDWQLTQSLRRKAMIGFVIQGVLFVSMSQAAWLAPYMVSIAENGFDPRSADFIIVVDKAFVLDPEFQVRFLAGCFFYLGLGSVFSAICAAGTLLPIRHTKTGYGQIAIFLLFLVNFAFTFYFLMVAHAGFSVGLMVTLRATFFAYIGASILGLVWAFLGRLEPSVMATRVMIGFGVLTIAGGLYFGFKPHAEVALVGDLDGRIGIVSGTPQSLTDVVRYGDFLTTPPEAPFKIRSLKSEQQALDLLEKGRINAAILPLDKIGDRPIIWQTSYLPPTDRTVATVSIVMGVLSLLLVVIGNITSAHPLAVFSDFFVDTIRGIPMLVIILYVGLPLAGALKSASGGYLDMAMMTRGVIAIAIGYSAYMAEIFRAGIEAVPKGQIEAARTLGLREWHIARLIVIPQAIAIVLPALGNEFIAMLKDTSLVSILSVRDLTQRMREFQAQSFLAFEPFNSAALIYVLLTILAASGIKALDNIVNKSRSHD